ncbi:MAG: energy-coupling factor transporter transmembrane protein EcfT [Clostridiales bacterium]|nr:energy-coupling factor transporter transmembrane protein EcfT [Clostridiales bacterium]
MDRFSKFHPLVGFSFFIAEIIISLIFINPAYLAVSFIGAFLYIAETRGLPEIKSLLKFVFPVIIFVGIFNMIFSHYGKTTLFSVGKINFTAESLSYGLCTGLMLGSVILWFSAYSSAMSSDKITAVFGKAAPNITLLFSMALRFVPQMNKWSDEITQAQTGLGKNIKGVKNTAKRFSALISISLEKSIETANTMKSRGFGKGKRKFCSRYSFRISDAVLLFIICLLFVSSLIFKFLGFSDFVYADQLEFVNFSSASFVIFAFMSFIPFAVDLKENIKWALSKSKI